MLHSLPQTHSSSTSDSPDDQSTHSGHAPRNQPPTDKYAHSSKNTVTSSPTTTNATTAAPASSSPVKSNSPTPSCPSVSMSQPTTPRPTDGSSPTTRQLAESTTTQPPPSSSSPAIPPPPPQHETLSFALQVPPPGYPYQAGNSDNNGKRKRREFDYTSDAPTFGMTSYNGNVYAVDRSTILDAALHAKVDRGFFLADKDWTCYRRNYFQISAALALQGVAVLYDGQDLPCFVRDDQHTFHQVQQFYVGVSARLSDCDKQIILVQHTAKRDKGPQNVPEPKPVRPGGNLSFSAVGANQSIVTFERIQFKSATANNGKRRAAQQYYVLVMELFAKIQSSGKMVPVATTTSQPLVVRGRSPGHYAESSSSSSTIEGSNMRHQQPYPHYYHHHPPSPLTSTPPMIPGHHHTPAYPSHAPPPGMYAPGYTPHHYPSTSTTSSSHSVNDMHYAYAPPHAGVPMVPNTGPPSSSSSNGAYDSHPPTTSQQTTTSTTTPPHQLPMPLRPPGPSSAYDQSYQHHYSSLPPPMHRSGSAPSTFDHPVKDEHTQHQQQQHHHHSGRFRIASTPSHPYHATPSPDHTGNGPSFAVGIPYSQPQPMPYYYSHPPPPPPPSHHGYGPPPHFESAPPPPPPADHGYPPNWKPWRPPNHMTQQQHKKNEIVKQESKDDVTKESTFQTENDMNTSTSGRA